MSKVLTLLVALALFGAMPAVAAAQGTPPPNGDGGDTVSSGNTQEGEIEQDAEAGHGGNAGNQACLIQQNAGRDANAACNQEQNFRTNAENGEGGNGHHHGHGGDVNGEGGETFGVGGAHGVGGGVQSVSLARTGFDAWILALLGGLSAAGGLGLLAAQRRGRLSA